MYRYVLSGKTIEQIEKMSDAEMSRLFLIKEPLRVINKRVSDLEPMLPEYAAMLKKRGITKGKVFEVYAAKYPDGFRSSAFLVRLNQYMQLSKPSLKMTHVAGDKMFVDFTGQKLHLVNAVTGEINLWHNRYSTVGRGSSTMMGYQVCYNTPQNSDQRVS